MLLKVIAYGPRGYWSDPWNRLDAIIVVLSIPLDLVPLASESLSCIVESQGAATSPGSARFLRIIRVIRPLRALRSFQATQDILKVFPASSGSMRDVLVLFFFIVTVYGVLGINLMGTGSLEDFEGSFHGRCTILMDIPEEQRAGIGANVSIVLAQPEG